MRAAFVVLILSTLSLISCGEGGTKARESDLDYVESAQLPSEEVILAHVESILKLAGAYPPGFQVLLHGLHPRREGWDYAVYFSVRYTLLGETSSELLFIDLIRLDTGRWIMHWKARSMTYRMLLTRD